MKTLSVTSLALLALFNPVSASELVLPPTLFLSTIDSDGLFNKLKSTPSFAALAEDNFGTPIRVIVSHRLKPTAGGAAAGFTSAILAGSSLGLLPMVTNNDLVVTYEIRVHDQIVAKQEYKENFTQAQNMYNTEGWMDKASKDWLLTTADRFIVDIASNSKVRELVDEYNFYFGE